MVTFKIFRYNPAKDKEPYFVSYEVPVKKGMTVLEGLYYIMENLDPSLAFRSSCRAAVCGSCAMHINGRYRLACNTQIEFLRSQLITLQPLSHLPILKDLIVDLTNFFKHYETIKPYLIVDQAIPDKEFSQSIRQRKKIDGLIDCLLCGACYASCPITGSSSEYLGPHALLKAARFIYDSRDRAFQERLNLIAQNYGLFRCHSIFNCQSVCPKNLDPAKVIARLKRTVIWHTIRRFLSI